MALTIEEVKILLLGYGSDIQFEGLRGECYVIEWRMMGMLLTISSIPGTIDFTTGIVRVRDGKHIAYFNMWLSMTFKERYRAVWGDIIDIDTNLDEIEKMLGLVFNLSCESNNWRQCQDTQALRHRAFPKSFPKHVRPKEPKA